MRTKMFAGLALVGALAVGGVAWGFGGSVVSCCFPGSECCFPGSPCCDESCRFAAEKVSAPASEVAAANCCVTGDCCCPGQGSCCDPAAKAKAGVTATAAKKAENCCVTGNCCCPGQGSCCTAASVVTAEKKDCCTSAEKKGNGSHPAQLIWSGRAVSATLAA